MANKIDQFWELFKAVSGDSSADVTDSANAIAKSDRTKVESYFSNVIDQYTFSTTDYNRLRKFLIDLYATHRSQTTISLSSTDPHALTNSDLDELFRSMGYDLSASLKGFDENPLEQKVQFFLDLVNLYKVKGTPQSLVDVLQYYGVTEVDIYEFFLKKDTISSLFFDGKAVAGTTVNPSDLALPYSNVTASDPHWLYTQNQILQLDQLNKINLPSKTPYIGIQPTVDLEGAEVSIISRHVQDEYDYYQTHGTVPSATAEITYIGETRSFLELYLSCIYMFNKLYDQGSDSANRFICYDGTNEDNEILIINEFESITQGKVETRDDLRTRYNSYIDLFSRPVAQNFLVDENTAATLLNTIAPDIKSSLDSAGQPLEVLYSLLKDLALWVRANIGFGFVNFGFILFGLQQFFTDLRPVIEFFKPYRARILLLENLQIRNRLFNTVVVEDSISYDVNLEFHDFLTADSTPCCSEDDSTCTNTVSVCKREFVGSVPSYNWRGLWQSGTSYSVDDAVSADEADHYICIQAHTAGLETRPDNGADWALYWQLMSQITCSDSTTASYYSRETFDCDSYFDIGAVSDIKQDINIEIQQEHYDSLKCPAIDGTGFVTSEILDVSFIQNYSTSIPSGGDHIVIYTEQTMPDTNYGIGLSVRFDPTVDPTEVPVQFAFLVTDKSQSSFEVTLSGSTPSDNYYIDWYVVDNTCASSIQIDTTSNSFTVNLSETQPDTNYSIAGTVRNIVDSNPSIYGFTIADKTTTSFRVILSGDIDSSNYMFDYFVCSGDMHDNTTFPVGHRDVTITLPQPLLHDTYPLTTVVETNDPSIYTWSVIQKTSTGFTVRLSGYTDSTGYNLSWIIPDSSYPGIETIDYYQSGGFRDFDEDGVFDCTFGFDLVQITIEDAIKYILQESGYYLLLEDGARIIL